MTHCAKQSSPAAIPLLALALTATGCATTAEAFGEKARYSPAFRGYVLGPHDGSHDPPAGASVLLLRDPLTGDKIACADQVDGVRELFEDLAADQLHDDEVAIGVGVGMGIALAPLAVVQPLGAAGMFYGGWATQSLYEGLASDDAEELVAQAIALAERRRHAQAEWLFLHALSRDPLVGITDKTLLHLGRAYLAQAKHDEARAALTLFVTRAGVRDVEAYEEAEALLRELSVGPEACSSREPIDLHW